MSEYWQQAGSASIWKAVCRSLAVVVDIHDALVKDSIRQVVYQHLDTDVCGSRVFLLLRTRVLLFPLGLALTVRLVALLDVLHDVLDRLFDGALTDTLPAYQHIHERPDRSSEYR